MAKQMKPSTCFDIGEIYRRTSVASRDHMAHYVCDHHRATLSAGAELLVA